MKLSGNQFSLRIHFLQQISFGVLMVLTCALLLTAALVLIHHIFYQAAAAIHFPGHLHDNHLCQYEDQFMPT